MYAPGMSGASIRLVELVNTNKEKTGKRLERCWPIIDRGDAPVHSHCSNLNAQAGLCANHPNNVRYRRARRPSPLSRNAVQFVVRR